MIVRDEVDVLARCLRSCRELLDYWVICDTGSTDGTQDLIARELAGIPGELHAHEWVDFGHNRRLLMEMAYGKADYLLLLDADWSLEALPGAFDGLTADSYMVRHAGAVEFANKRLVSGHRRWSYVGATHEYITSDEEQTCERLGGVVIHVHSVGGSRRGRWQRDIELLSDEVKRVPDNARATFYLAQTYKDLGHERADPDTLRAALEYYQRRAQMTGWDEETYCAQHQVGSLALELGEWPRAADALAAAWELRPQRLEAVHELAIGLRVRGHYHAAHQFTRIAERLEPLPVPSDILFVTPWIYRWGMLFEYSITSYWVGRFDCSIRACDRLLARRDLFAEHREQTRRNRTFAIQAQAREIATRAHRMAPA
jgi:Glycosyl transferase family 2